MTQLKKQMQVQVAAKKARRKAKVKTRNNKAQNQRYVALLDSNIPQYLLRSSGEMLATFQHAGRAFPRLFGVFIQFSDMFEAGLLKEKIWVEETPVEASDTGGNERYVDYTSFQSTYPSMFASENMSEPILEKCFSLLLGYLPDGHQTFIGLANHVEIITELAKTASFFCSSGSFLIFLSDARTCMQRSSGRYG
jgi:hypothetical protein